MSTLIATATRLRRTAAESRSWRGFGATGALVPLRGSKSSRGYAATGVLVPLHGSRSSHGYGATGALVIVLLFGLGFASIAEAQAPPETVEYYATDALGSVRVVFSATGEVLGRSDYLPFGETLNQSGKLPKQRFTGQERDGEAGLDYFNARSLQTRTGRMNRPDPLFADAMTDPQGWNRYAYVRNNPLGLTDPTGMVPGGGKDTRYYELFGQELEGESTLAGGISADYMPSDASGERMWDPDWTDVLYEKAVEDEQAKQAAKAQSQSQTNQNKPTIVIDGISTNGKSALKDGCSEVGGGQVLCNEQAVKVPSIGPIPKPTGCTEVVSGGMFLGCALLVIPMAATLAPNVPGRPGVTVGGLGVSSVFSVAGTCLSAATYCAEGGFPKGDGGTPVQNSPFNPIPQKQLNPLIPVNGPPIRR